MHVNTSSGSLWGELDGINVQQDGTTSHTANETLDFFLERFQGRTISQIGKINWPPRSSDLIPSDFFQCLPVQV